MVVAELVEQLFPTPEDRGPNPATGQKFILNVYCQLYLKDKK